MQRSRDVDQRVSEVQRNRQMSSRSKYIEDDNSYSQDYDDDVPDERYEGGNFVSKALSGANRFARQTGIVSKGLQYLGHPELARGARSFGYGMYQGSGGIIGGVHPEFKSTAVQRAMNRKYRQEHPRKRKPRTEGGISEWNAYVKSNYVVFRDEAIDFLNATSQQDDMRFFGHSPPNGTDLNRVAFIAMGYARKNNHMFPPNDYMFAKLSQPTKKQSRVKGSGYY